MRDIGFLQGIFIPQAFTYWLKHQLYRDNQWLIFSHKAFHLKTRVFLPRATSLQGKSKRVRKQMELFKGKPCVQLVTPFLCPARNKIKLQDAQGDIYKTPTGSPQ